MIVRLIFFNFELGVCYQICGNEDDNILIRQNGLSPAEVPGTGVHQRCWGRVRQAAHGAGLWHIPWDSSVPAAGQQQQHNGHCPSTFGKDWWAVARFRCLPQLADPASMGGSQVCTVLLLNGGHRFPPKWYNLSPQKQNWSSQKVRILLFFFPISFPFRDGRLYFEGWIYSCCHPFLSLPSVV